MQQYHLIRIVTFCLHLRFLGEKIRYCKKKTLQNIIGMLNRMLLLLLTLKICNEDQVCHLKCCFEIS